MDYILGYDCDGNEIYEYRVLRAIWSNDIDINERKSLEKGCIKMMKYNKHKK